jgi:signal transduction histidine kinase/ligand-binding sensor domain-containing protein
VNSYSLLLRGWVVGLVFSVVLAWCPYAFALDQGLDVSQYAHTAWKIREGFATGTIHQIAQTPDGYLWLATESGLLRFDGIRVVPWQPPQGEHLPSNDIRSLVAAGDGTLWLGTAKGLVSWKDGKLTEYPELDGHDVPALLQDHEGTIWASGIVWEAGRSQHGKLCAIKSGDVQCYGSDGSLGFGVTSMYEDSRGYLWLGTGNGLWRWRPGPPQRYALPELKRFAMPGMVFPRNAFLEGDHAALLIGGRDGIKQFVDGELKDYPLVTAAPFNEGGTLLRDRNGGLWIGTKDVGILHVHQGRTDVFEQSDGLSGNSIEDFFEDREGNIWVATINGLDRFRDYAVSPITVKQGLSTPSVGCLLAANDGSVWLGTSDGLNRWKEGRITVYRKPSESAARQGTDTAVSGIGREKLHGVASAKQPGATAHEISSSGLPDNYVTSLLQDVHGRIWVSTVRGLAYFENDRLVRLKGVHVPYLSQIAGDSTGNLWVTNNEEGLYRLSGGRVVEHFPWAKLGIHGSVSNPIVTDPVRGGLWLASWSGGVVYFKDGRGRESFGPSNGLGEGRVNALQLDSENTLWAATDGGLSRIKNGRVATLATSNGLPCDTVHDVVEDDARSLWLYMACGLVRVTRPELDAWVANPHHHVEGTVFDTSDGVRSHAGVYDFGPRVAKTADGKVYGATAGNQWLRLPALVRDLTIDYTALTFVAPEKVRFRYMLEGQDQDWKEVVNGRQVQYTNLRPGPYRFRVTACNNSGVWNETGTFLDFSIAPAYWQTNWFRAACMAALVALLWGLYQLRLRQVARQFNMAMEARIGERTRIARELHDTLLQSFHGLLLRFQAATNLLPEGEAKERFDSAIDQAAQAITEGRDAVQGLRSSTVVTNDLALAINTLGKELAGSESNPIGAKIHVGMEGAPRNLEPSLQGEVYRIAGEAMRNAFKHAQAERVEVEIRYDERQLRVRVRDDGKGIDPKLLKEEGRAGHFGLRGMRERARLLGGKLTVWSDLGSGTEVELGIPASRAYQESGPRRRWWLAEKSSRRDTEMKS